MANAVVTKNTNTNAGSSGWPLPVEAECTRWRLGIRRIGSILTRKRLEPMSTQRGEALDVNGLYAALPPEQMLLKLLQNNLNSAVPHCKELNLT
jgi:hypothetical protein